MIYSISTKKYKNYKDLLFHFFNGLIGQHCPVKKGQHYLPRHCCNTPKSPKSSSSHFQPLNYLQKEYALFLHHIDNHDDHNHHNDLLSRP